MLKRIFACKLSDDFSGFVDTCGTDKARIGKQDNHVIINGVRILLRTETTHVSTLHYIKYAVTYITSSGESETDTLCLENYFSLSIIEKVVKLNF